MNGSIQASVRGAMRFVLGVIVAGGLFSAPALGHEDADEAKNEPARFESNGSIRIAGQAIRYETVAAETFLYDANDEPIASIFSVSYLKQGEADPTRRPVTFVFNGGPGSASLWLHMGAWGPKYVDITPDQAANERPIDDGAPPYTVVDNPASLLDVSDLVFIDPIGTGYSRVLGDEEAKNHYGVREDARSVGAFIRRWLTENQRWNSPKYLAGESYGTTRAAALVNELTGGFNDVAFNGVILVSAILDFQTARFAPGNDTPHQAFLPTMAATAWHHDKVDRTAWDNDFDRFVDEARQFAAREYATALFLGAGLAEAEYDATAARLAAFTGLSEAYVRERNLRISAQDFFGELLREDGLGIGRFDGRFTTPLTNAFQRGDPSGFGIDAAYTAAVNDYYTRDLGIDLVRDYEVLSGGPGSQWNWSMEDGGGWPAYVNVTPWLARGMHHNPQMRVLLASGWYDLATPFFGAEISLQKNDVPQAQVERTYYHAGHMMYLRDDADGSDGLLKLGEDVRAFIRGR